MASLALNSGPWGGSPDGKEHHRSRKENIGCYPELCTYCPVPHGNSSCPCGDLSGDHIGVRDKPAVSGLTQSR